MKSNSQVNLQTLSVSTFYNRAGPDPESTSVGLQLVIFINCCPLLCLLHAFELGLGFAFDVAVVCKVRRTKMKECFCKVMKLNICSNGDIVIGVTQSELLLVDSTPTQNFDSLPSVLV